MHTPPPINISYTWLPIHTWLRGRALQQLGFPTKRSGKKLLRPVNPELLKRIGDRFGLSDDWVNEQAEKEGNNQNNQKVVFVTKWD